MKNKSNTINQFVDIIDDIISESHSMINNTSPKNDEILHLKNRLNALKTRISQTIIPQYKAEKFGLWYPVHCLIYRALIPHLAKKEADHNNLSHKDKSQDQGADETFYDAPDNLEDCHETVAAEDIRNLGNKLSTMQNTLKLYKVKYVQTNINALINAVRGQNDVSQIPNDIKDLKKEDLDKILLHIKNINEYAKEFDLVDNGPIAYELGRFLHHVFVSGVFIQSSRNIVSNIYTSSVATLTFCASNVMKSIDYVSSNIEMDPGTFLVGSGTIASIGLLLFAGPLNSPEQER